MEEHLTSRITQEENLAPMHEEVHEDEDVSFDSIV